MRAALRLLMSPGVFPHQILLCPSLLLLLPLLLLLLHLLHFLLCFSLLFLLGLLNNRLLLDMIALVIWLRSRLYRQPSLWLLINDIFKLIDKLVDALSLVALLLLLASPRRSI